MLFLYEKIFLRMIFHFICIYVHNFFVQKKINMQCPTCCHVMAWCHEDKQIIYFKCNNGTCVAAGMKCKYCNVIKLSKKDASKTSNISC